ncbi:hypothetical protein DFH09DRAFT_937763 [Mycena vulgaris]|nr:hypothetical protein DFH09DRAFT_937763 [Mycena vulgaris]
MNFQSLPIPPPILQDSGDPLRPVRRCGCDCIAGCRCACSCSDHCTCKAACEGDCTAHGSPSRNLVVSLDGAFNRLGMQSTTIAELHSRILVDPAEKQLTYYNCGIGTYVSGSPGTFKHWLQRFDNTVELAIGGNFKKIVGRAYRWLCEQYQPRDRIFLFGFSRGAYQVRALAAMITKVGLVNAGNQELMTSSVSCLFNCSVADVGVLEIFKDRFSRDIKVHFVGAWDTVSSPGLFAGKLHFPSPAEHVCIFRRALALDEHRVKILPADAGAGGKLFRNASWTVQTETDRVLEAKTNIKNVKEVWFAGSHADMYVFCTADNCESQKVVGAGS